MKRALGALMLGAAWLAAGCSDGAPEDPQVARGRAVYLANCIACHATDPSQAGGIGPDVAGSSMELLQARVVEGEYPAGYTPKRSSGVMPPFPHLAEDLPALHAFLAAAVKDGR